jgi:nitric oxide reductase NorE protein
LKLEASGERLTSSPGAPASEGLWTFVCIDMGIFLLIFFTFMIERSANVATYSLSQLRLDPMDGLANTLILLTSSWMVVKAVHAARHQAAAQVRLYLGIAVLLGVLFVINKIVEYTVKIRAGISPATNSFFSYYFFITFAHLMHVVAGIICIAYLRGQAAFRAGTAKFQTGLENVGLFWHFVDAVWLYIFPLLYLVGRP